MPRREETIRGVLPLAESTGDQARRLPLQLPLFDVLVLCCSCSRLKTENDRWSKHVIRVSDYPDTDFSHGICPTCLKRLYPVFVKRRAPESNTRSELTVPPGRGA
jgi:hypothetical protein